MFQQKLTSLGITVKYYLAALVPSSCCNKILETGQLRNIYFSQFCRLGSSDLVSGESLLNMSFHCIHTGQNSDGVLRGSFCTCTNAIHEGFACVLITSQKLHFLISPWGQVSLLIQTIVQPNYYSATFIFLPLESLVELSFQCSCNYIGLVLWCIKHTLCLESPAPGLNFSGLKGSL